MGHYVLFALGWVLSNGIIWLALYVWFALCLHMIARKAGTLNPWLAWIPFANIYLMCQVAGKPVWWTAILCLPFILAVILLLTFMATATGEGPAWFIPLLAVTIILIFISIILLIVVWVAIAKVRHKPSWLGILMIVPIVNLAIPGILAFSDGSVAGEVKTV